MYTIRTETFSDFCWFSNWKLYAFTFNWYGVIHHCSSAGVTMLGLYDKFKVYWRRRRGRRRDSLVLKASNDEVLVISIVTSSYEIIIKKRNQQRIFQAKNDEILSSFQSKCFVWNGFFFCHFHKVFRLNFNCFRVSWHVFLSSTHLSHHRLVCATKSEEEMRGKHTHNEVR